MGQWGGQGRGDGGQGTGTSARTGGSRRAMAAGERWNPETWLEPHRWTPHPREPPPPLARMQESLHPKSWVGLASWGRGDTGPAAALLRGSAHTHVVAPSAHVDPPQALWAQGLPRGNPQGEICMNKDSGARSPRVQSPAGPAVAWSDRDSEKRSVESGLGAPYLPLHPQHTPELLLHMDRDRAGILTRGGTQNPIGMS